VRTVPQAPAQTAPAAPAPPPTVTFDDRGTTPSSGGQSVGFNDTGSQPPSGP
jgi:hypothetical protein